MHGIERSRNTEKQLNWYESRKNLLSSVDPETIANSFPVFASRQNITRFLEIIRYWKLLESIPGNIIECGVAGGSFLFALAHLCSIYEPHHYTRKLVGFDTFTGFTEPSSQDLSSNAEHMNKGGLTFDSYDYLQEAINLYDQNRMIGNINKISLYKGDISQTFPQYLDSHPSSIIGLLHLDLDLYKPTKDVLKYAVSRMPKGSIIVFDEPNHDDYPGETIAIMETLGLRDISMQRVPESSMAAFIQV